MRMHPDTLTFLAREGRLTLQIPDLVLDVRGVGLKHQSPGSSDPYYASYEDFPDDWFCYLSDDVPVFTGKSGLLYFTRKGYEANKKLLLDAFSDKRGISKADFEQHAEKHFADVEKKVAKKIVKLLAQTSELQNFVL